MNTRTSSGASLKHSLEVATIVLFSIPGVLTALSPIAMPFVSTGARAIGSSQVVAVVRHSTRPLGVS